MRVTVATEVRLLRGPDGVIRSSTAGRGFLFWTRYMAGFDSVTVLARVADSASTVGSVVTGPGVHVAELLDYSGPRGLVRVLLENRKRVERACSAADTAFLARVPGLVGSMAITCLRRKRRVYGLEVVGDPHEVMRWLKPSPSLRSAVGQIAASLQMRCQCRGADAVSYVTENELQRLYPASRTALVTHYSSVELPPEAYAARSRAVEQAPVSLSIITVANQGHRYKGQDVLIKAVSLLITAGRKVKLTLVGDGALNTSLRMQSRYLGIEEHVLFTGEVATAAEIRCLLDESDLFVLPTYTEGLPRALLEAMARGLPCLASDVGGIPEVLQPRDMLNAGDALALANKIASVATDSTRLRSMSQENLAVSRRYASEVLETRRRAFYESWRLELDGEVSRRRQSDDTASSE